MKKEKKEKLRVKINKQTKILANHISDVRIERGR